MISPLENDDSSLENDDSSLENDDFWWQGMRSVPIHLRYTILHLK